MRTRNLTYWISTGLFATLMVATGYGYLTSDFFKNAFVHLGFPASFRIELAVAKLLGAVALLLPAVGGRAKEWVYAGFFITLISGVIAHFTAGDPASTWGGALVVLLLLTLSYISYRRRQASAMH